MKRRQIGTPDLATQARAGTKYLPALTIIDTPQLTLHRPVLEGHRSWNTLLRINTVTAESGP
jgi:hypothetical protein